jgi:putative nucleotidyltransferase with HDIG domain
MAPTIDEVIEGMPKLASYAGVLNELDEVLNDMNSTLAEICEVIEKDPAMAAKLLQLGNTCFFGFSRRVETVFETISLIGIQQVRDLIAASTVMRMFAGVSSEHVDMESFWQHSLSCAVAARILAIDRQLPKPEKHFTAGLLHDIGRLVLYSRLPEQTAAIFQLYEKKRILLRDAEKTVLGYDHAELGAALVKSWNYPFNLIHAVRFHHMAMAAGAFQVDACIIHLADHLVCAMELGTGGDGFIPPLSMHVWERLGMTTDALQTVVDAIDEQYKAVVEVFLSPEKKA